MRARISLLPVCLMAFACAGAVADEALFEEVSAQAGIVYTGQSWGSAWGDFNGDGWLDLWATNHGALPHLYLNDQQGGFVEIAEQVVPEDVWTYYRTTVGSYDAHGAAWLDVDRDGDLDLFQGADGNRRNQPNHLLINEGGQMFAAEVAELAGVAAPRDHTRRPVGFDWNADGYVDISTFSANSPAMDSPLAFFESLAAGPGILFQDKTESFSAVSNNKLLLATVSDLDDDNQLELLTGPTPNFLRAFEFEQGMPTDISAELNLLGTNYLVDGAVADFDGDLDQDIFIVRGESPRDLVVVDGKTIEATVYPQSAEEGISFSAVGEITVSIYPNYQFSTSSIYVGSAGTRPLAELVSQGYVFTLSDADPGNYGIAPHNPGTSYGHYVGYDPQTGKWSILVSSNGSAQRNIVVAASESISDVEALGFDPLAQPGADLYFRNEGGSFAKVPAEAGFTGSSSARSVAAGDFDNDGDVDLYVVTTSIVQNRPNRLYLNDGNGVFSAVAAHGAEGPVEGRGDSVSVADYDNDGFLDLFVSNGKDKAPFYFDGPSVLFRNRGNGNHWIELDLVGSESEIQGIGAKITVTAGGRSQVRLHGNSYNGRSQHMLRSHFGLGAADAIDEIEVEWPSGNVQVLEDVAADQILTIREPTAGDPCIPSFPVSEGVLEDAEDGLTAGWDIYDANPAGASVSNVCDEDRGSRVIELSGSGLGNGYRLRGEDLSPWGNLSETTIEWSMNFAQAYTIYVDVATSAGQRYLTYTPSSVDDLGSGRYVRHGLGGSSAGGGWVTVVRDLQADLSEAQPGVVITAVNGFLVRGDGRLDDIQLRVAGTTYEDAEDGTTQGWDIYDANPSGAEILNVQDIDRGSRVIELSGSGLGNGYRLRGEDLSPWGNLSETTIEWSMNFAQAYTIYVDVATSAGQRYLTYTPSSVDDLGSGRYVRHGLGGSSAGGSWVTVVRDLQADLSEAQPGVVITAVNGFLVRGDGRLDEIRLQAAP